MNHDLAATMITGYATGLALGLTFLVVLALARLLFWLAALIWQAARSRIKRRRWREYVLQHPEMKLGSGGGGGGASTYSGHGGEMSRVFRDRLDAPRQTQ